MRRTQLYLDDNLWEALHAHARRERTTVSDLVRKAARDRYLAPSEERSKAMRAIVGMWRDRPEFSDPEEYVRKLRRGERITKLRQQ